MTAKYKIDGIGFQRKQDIKTYIQQLVKRTPDFIDLQGADYKFMRELFYWHPRIETKFPSQILRIWIQPQMYGARGFMIDFVEGGTDDISWHKCVNNIKTVTASLYG